MTAVWARGKIMYASFLFRLVSLFLSCLQFLMMVLIIFVLFHFTFSLMLATMVLIYAGV
jgi:hypothetical protein